MSIAKRLQLPSLITLTEASKILQVHPNTLRLWEKRGRLESVRTGSRGDRSYTREEIVRFISTYKKFNYPENTTSSEESMSQIVVNRLIQKFDRLQIMSTSLGILFDINQVLDESVKQMGYISKCDVSFMYRFNKDKTQLTHWSSNGDKQLSKDLHTIQANYLPQITQLIHAKEPAILQINSESIRRNPQLIYYPLLLTYKSFLFAPIISEAEVLGVIGIAYRDKKQFIKEDVILMQAISRICSQSIERSFIYEREKKIHTLLLSTHQLLKRVNQSAIRFLKVNKREEVNRLIVEEARKLIHAEYGSIFLVQNGELVRTYASDQKLYQMQARPRGDTYKTYTDRQAKVYVVKKRNEPHPMLIDLGVKSVVRIPLYYDDESIGVLNMLLLKREKISDEELKILEFYGVLATLALRQDST